MPALLVLGPFMQSERQAEFVARGGPAAQVEAITFDAQLEQLMARAERHRRDGRLQHLLRDPVLRQAGAHRAAHRGRGWSRRSAPPRAEELGLARMLAEDGPRDRRRDGRRRCASCRSSAGPRRWWCRGCSTGWPTSTGWPITGWPAAGSRSFAWRRGNRASAPIPLPLRRESG
jgi:hypothetical protein